MFPARCSRSVILTLKRRSIDRLQPKRMIDREVHPVEQAGHTATQTGVGRSASYREVHVLCNGLPPLRTQTFSLQPRAARFT